MFKIKYTAKAEDKLFQIYNFIALDNPFIAAKVIMKIKSSIDILWFFPLSWKVLEDNYRFIVDSKYNYKIIYQISNWVVYIISIFKYENTWR